MKWYWFYLLICGVSGWHRHVAAQEMVPDSTGPEIRSGYISPVYDTGTVSRMIDSGKANRFTDGNAARGFYLRAAMASRASGYTEGLVRSLTGLAEVRIYAGQYDQAIRHYQEALHYRKDVSLKALSDIYTGLTGVYTYKSQYAQAAYFCYKYLEIAETSPDRHPPLARTYNNLSALWHLLHDKEKQLKYITLAEKAALVERDSGTLGTALFRRGTAILDTNTALALELYDRSLAIGRQTGDNHVIIASLLNMGWAYTRLEQQAEALRYYRTADSLLEVLPDNPFNKLSFYISLGTGYFMLGMNDLAEQHALRVIGYSEQLQSRTYQGRAYNLLSAVYERIHDYPRAFASQKAYIALKDSLAGGQVVQSANLSELKYLTVKQDHELALHQLEIVNHEAQILRKNILIAGIAAGILLLAAGSWILYRNMRMRMRMQQQSIQSLHREKEIEQMKAIMKGEDQESIRIGQELHDGIGSMLSVIKMNLSMIQHQHTALQGSGAYQQIIGLIDKTSTDLRETAHNLMLDSLLQGGLDEALQFYAEKCSEKYQVPVHFLSYGEPPPVSPDFERSVYRIMRELLYHVVRQKNVTLVMVQLNWQGDLLSIILEDDAQPVINKNTVQHLKEGSGIFPRIDALNGHIDIEHGPERGTTIDIEFDLREDG